MTSTIVEVDGATGTAGKDACGCTDSEVEDDPEEASTRSLVEGKVED